MEHAPEELVPQTIIDIHAHQFESKVLLCLIYIYLDRFLYNTKKSGELNNALFTGDSKNIYSSRDSTQ